MKEIQEQRKFEAQHSHRIQRNTKLSMDRGNKKLSRHRGYKEILRLVGTEDTKKYKAQ